VGVGGGMCSVSRTPGQVGVAGGPYIIVRRQREGRLRRRREVVLPGAGRVVISLPPFQKATDLRRAEASGHAVWRGGRGARPAGLGGRAGAPAGRRRWPPRRWPGRGT